MPPSQGPQFTETTRQPGRPRPRAGPTCSGPRWPPHRRPARSGRTGRSRTRRGRAAAGRRVRDGSREQAAEARDLGVVDGGELGVGLVLDPPVGEHPRAVDQAADRPELGADRVEARRRPPRRRGRRPGGRRPSPRPPRSAAGCGRSRGWPRPGGTVRRSPAASPGRCARAASARLISASPARARRASRARAPARGCGRAGRASAGTPRPGRPRPRPSPPARPGDHHHVARLERRDRPSPATAATSSRVDRPSPRARPRPVRRGKLVDDRRGRRSTSPRRRRGRGRPPCKRPRATRGRPSWPAGQPPRSGRRRGEARKPNAPSSRETVANTARPSRPACQGRPGGPEHAERVLDRRRHPPPGRGEQHQAVEPRRGLPGRDSSRAITRAR